MEVWDLYDCDRVKLSKTILRGNKLESGDYHIVVHVIIFNKQGQMLIQKRHPDKVGWPNMWDISVGGSAISGESSSQAAQRELEEELGIVHDFSNLRPAFTINFETGFDDMYLVEKNLDLNNLKLQEDEVIDARWATKEEILEMMSRKTFIPYFESLIILMFEMKSKLGAINE